MTTLKTKSPKPIKPWVEVEKNAIIDAYALCGDDACLAAKALGISKSKMYRKLKSYGVKVKNDRKTKHEKT